MEIEVIRELQLIASSEHFQSDIDFDRAFRYWSEMSAVPCSVPLFFLFFVSILSASVNAAEGPATGEWNDIRHDIALGSLNSKYSHYSENRFPPWQIVLGRFKQPFGMEEISSSRYLAFVDPGVVHALAPGNVFGIGTHYTGNQWTFSASLFGDERRDSSLSSVDKRRGASSRFTYAPVLDSTKVLHLGAALSFEEQTSDRGVQFAGSPDSLSSELSALNTGYISEVSGISRYSLETAWSSGPFALQGEWMNASLLREDQENVSFNGWYAQTSWLLTGESRSYRPDRGLLGEVDPLNRYGAVEVAARVSQLDLNDGDILGGVGWQYSLGVNWYLSTHMRLTANYTKLENEQMKENRDRSSEHSSDIFQLRFRAEF